MTLSEKQRLFANLLGQLLEWIYQNDFEVTLGEAYRTPEQAAWNAQKAHTGIVKSLHCVRLAIDLNLFIEGEYQTLSESYRPLGAHWKILHPLCRWGGDFSHPDGNHFSLENEGVK